MYTVSEMSPGKSWGGRHFLFASFTKRDVYMVLYSQVNFFGVILRPRRGCRQKKNAIKAKCVIWSTSLEVNWLDNGLDLLLSTKKETPKKKNEATI